MSGESPEPDRILPGASLHGTDEGDTMNAIDELPACPHCRGAEWRYAESGSYERELVLSRGPVGLDLRLDTESLEREAHFFCAHCKLGHDSGAPDASDEELATWTGIRDRLFALRDAVERGDGAMASWWTTA